MAASFLKNTWTGTVDFSKNVDWPMILGVVFLILMVGLLVALTIRHNARARLLSHDWRGHFTSKHLPVAYLSKTGEMKDMLLNHSQYIVFGTLNNKVANMRHGMCTDDPGWTHYCLLSAAEAYQRLTDSASGQFGKVSSQEDTVDSVVAASVNDMAEPYVRFLYSSKTDVPSREVEDALSTARTTARGVSGLPIIDDISSQNISVVSI